MNIGIPEWTLFSKLFCPGCRTNVFNQMSHLSGCLLPPPKKTSEILPILHICYITGIHYKTTQCPITDEVLLHFYHIFLSAGWTHETLIEPILQKYPYECTSACAFYHILQHIHLGDGYDSTESAMEHATRLACLFAWNITRILNRPPIVTPI